MYRFNNKTAKFGKQNQKTARRNRWIYSTAGDFVSVLDASQAEKQHKLNCNQQYHPSSGYA